MKDLSIVMNNRMILLKNRSIVTDIVKKITKNSAIFPKYRSIISQSEKKRMQLSSFLINNGVSVVLEGRLFSNSYSCKLVFLKADIVLL